MAPFKQQHKGGARPGERHQDDEALFIRDYFRRWPARFELGAHFLDLSCLLFELRRQNLHLFLLQATVDFKSAILACCSSTFLGSLRNSLSNITSTAS
jgi:hypothetical protein